MDRRGDTIYKYGGRELGCCEVAAANDPTKMFRDCSLKMPLVSRDMLLQLTYDLSLLHNSHVIRFSITGGNASLLDINIPAEYITRVGKTDPLEFPHSDAKLVSMLLPLFTLAYNGKKIIDETVELLDSVSRPITTSTGGEHWCLPGNFLPTPSTSSGSTSPSK